MSSTSRERVEIFVGLFLLVGLAFVGVMVVMFGRGGQTMGDSYRFTVEFPDASGLIKDSNVFIAGARVGRVAEPPLLLGESFRVAVTLEIQNNVRIPRAATFVIGSSGLLGDRFVDVRLPATFDPAETIAPGTQIAGSRAGGLDELTGKGGVVMDQLAAEMERIKVMTTRINDGLLSPQNMRNLEETFANLKATTEGLKVTSQNLNGVIERTSGVVEKAGSAMDAAKGTMETADKAAADLRLAIADLRKTTDSATKTIDTTGVLLRKATAGDGALGMLLNDRQMADDLRALVSNMRRSGVLFYKDRPAPAGQRGQAPRR
jgi:virulence factor Mce-like protein